MTPKALHDLFRAHVRDEEYPYLWSETEVYLYMDEAQKMFCRRAGGIRDSLSDLCTVGFDAGDAFVDYDKRILKLRHAKLDGRPIEIVNSEDIEYMRPAQPGRVCMLVLGDDAYTAFLRDIPTEDGKLQLHVERLPLEPITGPDSQLEIDDLHHYALLDWMVALAYNKQDAETYDKSKAEERAAKFLSYCDQAKTEQGRREHKYRTISYGGI